MQDRWLSAGSWGSGLNYSSQGNSNDILPFIIVYSVPRTLMGHLKLDSNLQGFCYFLMLQMEAPIRHKDSKWLARVTPSQEQQNWDSNPGWAVQAPPLPAGCLICSRVKARVPLRVRGSHEIADPVGSPWWRRVCLSCDHVAKCPQPHLLLRRSLVPSLSFRADHHPTKFLKV